MTTATPGEFREVATAVRGTRVRGLVAGPEEGEPLVLLHGLGGSSANWGLIAPSLARRRRVLVVDLPGHGRSEPLPAAPTLAPYAHAVLGLAEQEGFLPATFVGHSFGGLVAIRTAVRRPEAVRGLVLVSAAGITSSTRMAERVLAFVGWVQPGRRISRYWRAVATSDAARLAVFSHWMAHDPLALDERAVEALLSEINLHTDTDSAWRALARDDPRHDLHLVECPAVLVWGAEDNQLPIDDAFDYARRLRAPLRVIAGCGHLPIVERPEACIGEIESFLDSERAARGGPSHRGAQI